MGADFSDYNNDGWPDILVDALSLQSYVVFRNTRGEFVNVSEESGLYRYTLAHSGWGIKFVDVDNDGWRDIFVAQGHVLDTITIDYPNIAYKQKLLLLHSIRGKFVDASDAAGATFQIPLAARGAAFGDFNNDGSCDVALNINDGPAIDCAVATTGTIGLRSAQLETGATGMALALPCGSSPNQVRNSSDT